MARAGGGAAGGPVPEVPPRCDVRPGLAERSGLLFHPLVHRSGGRGAVPAGGLREVRPQVSEGRPEPVPAFLLHCAEHQHRHRMSRVRGLPGLALGQPQAVPRPQPAGQGRHRPDAAGDDGAGRQRRGAARLRRAARAGQGGPGRRAGPGGHLEPELVPRGVRAQGPRHPSLLRPRADAEGRQGRPGQGAGAAGGGLPTGEGAVAAGGAGQELVGLRARGPAQGALPRGRRASGGREGLDGCEADFARGGSAAGVAVRDQQG
mmetsp:Transcript_123333/g.331268  ORF Transcript_123333/g.331268 Transcript_123333/m.331268 type:complete len:262 (+) Transcript_123333:2513-3298(+)